MRETDWKQPLDEAFARAIAYREGLPERPVGVSVGVDERLDRGPVVVGAPTPSPLGATNS